MKKGLRLVSLLVAAMLLTGLAACTSRADTISPNAPENSPQPAGTPEPASTTEPLPDGVVSTTAGLVQGIQTDGVYRYLGIPYAQATDRFVRAQPVESWDGILQADHYGAISPQGAISGMGGSGNQNGTDNNCQNLNIWTPGIGDEGK